MNFNIQPILENNNILLQPLEIEDFEDMYITASDFKIWEQHPNKNRWKKDVFKTYFEGAISSKGAFKIINKSTREIIGCTRFYDYKKEDNSILIGYTFYATAYWGKGINIQVKKLMLDHIFPFVNTVIFYIGAENIRSQIAISRLGAIKIAEENIAYFGEDTKLNYVYGIGKKDWIKNSLL